MNHPTHTHASNTAPHATGSRAAGEQGLGRAGTPPEDSQPRTETHSGAGGYVRLPLELTIYPHSQKHLNTNWLTFYETPEGLMTAGQAGVIPAAKHFSDAELAAEVWGLSTEYTRTASQILYQTDALQNEHITSHFRETERKGNILQRFAISPHYFEVAE